MTPPPAAAPPKAPGGFLRNSLFIAVSRGLQIAAGFFVLIAVARHLSEREFGTYASVLATAQAVMSLSYFGIQDVVVREIAKDRSKASEYLGAGAILRLALSLAAGAVLFCIAWFSDLPPMAKYAFGLAYALEFFRSFGLLACAVFQAYERMGWEPLLSMIQAVLTLGLVGAAVALDLKMTGILAALALALGVHFCCAALAVERKFVRPSLRPPRGRVWGMFATAAVIGLGIILQMNLMRLGTIMLGLTASETDVARFQVAHEFVIKLEVFPQALMLAAFPALSRLLGSDRKAAETLYRGIFRYVFLLGILPCLYLTFFPEQVLLLLYGEKYLAAAPVMRVAGLALVPLSLDMLLGKALIAMNKQRYALYYAGAALLVCAALNVILIPRWGPVGAAWSSLAAYMCLLCFSVYFAARHGVRPKIGKDVLRAAFAASLGLGAAHAAVSHSTPLAAALLGAVYLGALAAVRSFPKKDMMELKSLLRPGSPGPRGPKPTRT